MLMVCLNFAINSVDKLIVGIDNVDQLKQIFKVKIKKRKLKIYDQRKKLIDPIYWLKFHKK